MQRHLWAECETSSQPPFEFVASSSADIAARVWAVLYLIAIGLLHRIGGRGGIRTHGTFRFAGFQDQSLQPLGHSSVLFGAATKVRTRDILITNQALFQLSYSGLSCIRYKRFAFRCQELFNLKANIFTGQVCL